MILIEEPPSTVVAGVLDDLAPREEVVESKSGAEGMDTQSFAFDVGREEEHPTEAPVEQVPTEVERAKERHVEVAPVEEMHEKKMYRFFYK